MEEQVSHEFPYVYWVAWETYNSSGRMRGDMFIDVKTEIDNPSGVVDLRLSVMESLGISEEFSIINWKLLNSVGDMD